MSNDEHPNDRQSSDDSTNTSKSTNPPTMEVVEEVNKEQLQHFVTAIKSAEQQVGENIIQALQHQGTVAVLTTVASGPDGQQCVVSAALSPTMLEQVRNILASAAQERIDEEPCVGFHCLIQPKQQPPASE